MKKIRELKNVAINDSNLFKDCIRNSIKNITSWNTESEYQIQKIKFLLKDVRKFLNFLDTEFNFQTSYPFNTLYLWLEKETCEECIEYIVSIMLEPFGDLVQPLIKEMSSDEEKYFNIPTERTIGDLVKILEEKYSNILTINFDKKENNKKFWFISKNKEEPRLADRFEEQGSDLEQPLAIARDIKKLYERSKLLKKSLKIDKFLINNSDLRHVIRRAFIIENFLIQKSKTIL